MSERTDRRAVIKKITPNTVILILSGILSGMVNLTYGISVFGFVMLCAFYNNNFSLSVCILPILGYFLSGNIQNALFYTFACLLICAIYFFKDKLKISAKWWKVVCCSVLLLTETLRCYFGGFLYYYILIIALEVIITYFLIDYYEVYISYFSTKRLRRALSKKELFALIMVLFISLSALSDYTFLYGIKPIGIVSVYIIFCVALLYECTTSAAFGTLLGFLVSISSPELLYISGSYSLSSFFAGLGKKYSKAGVVLSFIITNAVITFYINGSEYVLINIYEVMIAGLLFFITPANALENFKTGLKLLSPGRYDTELKRVDYMRESTYRKLMKLSDAFYGLSASLKGKNRGGSELNTSMLSAEVKKRVCENCGNCHYCWRAEDDYTKKTFDKLIETAAKRGYAEGYDLSARFKNYCLNPGRVVLEANKIYELFRVNKVWESKIDESRKIIRNQLKDVSEIVEGFAEDFTNVCDFETDAEKNIITILDSMGITVMSVTVARDMNLRFYVKVSIRQASKRKTNEGLVLTAVNKVLSVNMRITDCDIKDDCYIFELSEAERFEILTSVSKIRAVNENSSGDSYAIIKPGDGKAVIALSDGMGTGDKAKEKSMETVNLLESLMGSGIKKENAIKLINSVLILKSFDESFATLDILILDLYTGEGEFVKTGGVASYIKRNDEVLTVDGDGLPTGILADVSLSSKKIKFLNGDEVVIMSDGVLDCFDSPEEICSAIKAKGQNNLKAFADGLIECALGCKKTRSDDMTVIAVKIIEK